MFNKKEIEIILKWLDLSKTKVDELKDMIGGEVDEEMKEIYDNISSIVNKLNSSNLNFSERELSEMRTWIMWLLVKEWFKEEITNVLEILNKEIN